MSEVSSFRKLYHVPSSLPFPANNMYTRKRITYGEKKGGISLTIISYQR